MICYKGVGRVAARVERLVQARRYVHLVRGDLLGRVQRRYKKARRFAQLVRGDLL